MPAPNIEQVRARGWQTLVCQQKKESGIAWDKIGFFSFSKKAAYEARDRAREKFKASKDDLVHFRTLHSFALSHLPQDESKLMKSKIIMSSQIHC